MSKMRKVTNDQVLEAYGNPNDPIQKLTPSQKDNRKVIKKVTSKYMNRLSEEELESCALEAIWRCLGYHEEGRGNKFTTSLWMFTEFECQRELTKQTKGRNNTVSLGDFENIESGSKNFDSNMSSIYEHISLLNKPYSDLIFDYYVNKMTMEEIGVKNGFSKETARQKIKKGVNQLREIYKDID